MEQICRCFRQVGFQRQQGNWQVKHSWMSCGAQVFFFSVKLPETSTSPRLAGMYLMYS